MTGALGNREAAGLDILLTDELVKGFREGNPDALL